MSLHAAVTEVLMSAPANVPSLDIFGTSTNLGSKFKNAALSIAGAGIGWMLLKNLFKTGLTATGAVLAIACAAGLFWFLDNVDNERLRKPLDDTVVNNLGAPPLRGVVRDEVVHVHIVNSSS